MLSFRRNGDRQQPFKLTSPPSRIMAQLAFGAPIPSFLRAEGKPGFRRACDTRLAENNLGSPIELPVSDQVEIRPAP